MVRSLTYVVPDLFHLPPGILQAGPTTELITIVHNCTRMQLNRKKKIQEIFYCVVGLTLNSP